VEAAERVHEAMRAVPRARYLPRAQRFFAPADMALPIGHGQTNSQPSTVRAMLELLDVRPGQRVLDVGAGSGWTTAILAHLTGPTGSVVGLERVPALVEMATANVRRAGMPWARVARATPGVFGRRRRRRSTGSSSPPSPTTCPRSSSPSSSTTG